MTSSNDRPDWFDEGLSRQAEKAADEDYPNEVCGLFYRTTCDAAARLWIPRSINASPSQCFVDPAEVIQFAYTVIERGGQVTATFHSHPGGEPMFSIRDGSLRDWAKTHLLLARRLKGGWDMIWGQSE